MGIRLDDVGGFKDLIEHVGHDIVLVTYSTFRGPVVNVAIECETCNLILLDFNAPTDDDVELWEEKEAI